MTSSGVFKRSDTIPADRFGGAYQLQYRAIDVRPEILYLIRFQALIYVGIEIAVALQRGFSL